MQCEQFAYYSYFILCCMCIMYVDDPSITIFGGVSLGYFTGVISGESEQLFIEPAYR